MPERRNLNRAIAQDDLQLHYQPIVNPRTGATVSAEALLRGREEDRRDWNIAETTAQAERENTIFALDHFIMGQACKDAANWRRAGLRISLNLNFSAREFQNRDFTDSLDQAAAEAAIDPRDVILEVTETAAIHDPSHAEKIVAHLQSRGHQIWLDDFGTGHSSLEWLKWFPVNGLKIPGSFIKDLSSDHRCQAIVEAIVSFGKRLDVTVVAEGVENQQQLDLLLDQGIDLVQGYFFYPPFAAEELQAKLHTVKEHR